MKDYLFTAFLGLFMFIPAVVIMFLIALICPEQICGKPIAVLWIIPMAAGSFSWIYFWYKFLEWYKETYQD